MLITGCSADSDEPDTEQESTPDSGQARTSLPGDEVTVLTGDQPAELALGVSQALFDQAPVVVLVGENDPASHEETAPAAAELGIPLLLAPEPGTAEADEALGAEIARLAPTAVLTVGTAAAQWGEQLGDGVEVMQAGPDLTVTAEQARPAVTRPDPLPSVTVIAPEDGYPVAATATAEAAGARVLTTRATDPRTDPDLIAALAEQPPEQTIALGDDFGSAKQLRGRLRVAATGVELPGGGQVLFPDRRFVALYGHPGDPGLGVLGEQSRDQAIERAGELAAEYEEIVDEPAVPALEIITTVASASKGPEGDYSRRTPIDKLRPWVDAAREAGTYVVLDLQPGHTDFLTQAKEYEELLAEPHVGLALDPEWRLAPDQRHMRQIGSVDGSEVNEVIEWLADLTAEHHLPQKLLVLHQFRLDMITSRGDIDTDRDEVAVLVHADGFGSRSQKLATWRALHADAPDVWWGWKNFYDEDRPTFSPEQTIELDPAPRFISYQ